MAGVVKESRRLNRSHVESDKVKNCLVAMVAPRKVVENSASETQDTQTVGKSGMLGSRIGDSAHSELVDPPKPLEFRSINQIEKVSLFGVNRNQAVNRIPDHLSTLIQNIFSFSIHVRGREGLPILQERPSKMFK